MRIFYKILVNGRLIEGRYKVHQRWMKGGSKVDVSAGESQSCACQGKGM
jgi:hypothetical protein